MLAALEGVPCSIDFPCRETGSILEAAVWEGSAGSSPLLLESLATVLPTELEWGS